jgi:hypothetical protein
MAFITVGGNVVSYAEALDIKDKDQRIYESNEINFTDVPDAPGSLDDYLEDLATKTTNRINQKIRLSTRWQEYLGYVGTNFGSLNTIPDFQANNIVTRKPDFTDMCSYGVLYMYLLPKVADFGNPESAEVQKIQYFESRFNSLFDELMADFTWYDSSGDGSVSDNEKLVSYRRNKRTRGNKSVVRVS